MEPEQNTINNPNKEEIKNDLAENNPPHVEILSPDALKNSGKDDN